MVKTIAPTKLFELIDEFIKHQQNIKKKKSIGSRNP